ncbi:exopolysaccharide Pel transporter PelG [Clostridium sp. DL1XJH146]
MAGIGFELKRMFKDDTFTNRSKAYLYSALVSAGPWISSVITVNLLLFIMEFNNVGATNKDLFSGTIVYSFVFSQILTAPWQFLITRYISDKLYTKDYKYIRPSFIGLNKIVFFLSFFVSIFFYWNKPLPLYYKIMAIYVFLIISMIWILMVYLSAVKNYELIAKAYIIGGSITFILAFYLLYNPINFTEFIPASNLLFSYLVGISFTFIMLIYNFLSTFYFGNNYQYDFLRYLSKYSSLFFIGLFYTLGLWSDNILMWFSEVGMVILDTYHFSPLYDNAVFLAYLTIIPTMVLFLVIVETDFYSYYKNYFGLANKRGTLKEIKLAEHKMVGVLYNHLIYTFEVQALISITIILLAKPIFKFLNFNTILRNIFRVTSFGTLFNIFILLIILVLLYFEVRKRAFLVSFLFFIFNTIFTLFFRNKGIQYYGYGFVMGTFITFCIGAIILSRFTKKISYNTFALQPLYAKKEKGIFAFIADSLNFYNEIQESNSKIIFSLFKIRKGRKKKKNTLSARRNRQKIQEKKKLRKQKRKSRKIATSYEH